MEWFTKRKGKKIISLSLGGSSAPNAVKQMCDAAWNKGVLLVAGNNGPGPNTVGFPGKCGNVVAISAIDSSNFIATFILLRKKYYGYITGTGIAAQTTTNLVPINIR